jgi:enamine deaminase RidA (YjgF/YER057c/UK114 family)
MPEKVSWEQINRVGNTLLSPAYKSNGHVFTSGSVGTDPVTNELPDDVESQTENAIQNLKHVLTQSGSSIDKVLKVLLLIRDPKDAPAINKIYAKHFKTQPARSAIIVGFPNPKLKVELEAVAEYQELKSNL